ncbi:hypothetical protein BJ944DRAFT_269096 [Cunninghamella echinulata]|nr:hypothetical protein BJ944DRAFT_269096 [Cunninghamella echinulata]
MVLTIEEYKPTQKKWIELFCSEYYNKNRYQHIFKKITVQCKRLWSYGIVVIVAHAFGGHSLWRPSSSFITYFNATTSTTNTLVIELTIWSAGVGMACYVWLSQLYIKKIKEKTTLILDAIQQAQQEPKSNIWVMKDKKEENKIIGLAILNYRKEDEDDDSNNKKSVVDEGQIQVFATESRIELALVQNAMQYARQQDIKVVTRKNKLDHFF